jgi:hypothetical protein
MVCGKKYQPEQVVDLLYRRLAGMQESLSRPAATGVRAGLRFLCRLVVVGVFHEYLLLEGQNWPIAATWYQALARADAGGFLEGGWSIRQAVPAPMPSSREMTFHAAPAARRLVTWRGLTANGGSLAPWAFPRTDLVRIGYSRLPLLMCQIQMTLTYRPIPFHIAKRVRYILG